MMRNLQQVYAYVVCLLTLMCAVVAGGLFAYNIIRVSAPTFTLNTYMRQSVSSNLDFRKDFNDKDHPMPADEAEVTKLREQRYQLLLDMERQGGWQGITFEGIILLIDAIVFLLHWRLRRATPETALA